VQTVVTVPDGSPAITSPRLQRAIVSRVFDSISSAPRLSATALARNGSIVERNRVIRKFLIGFVALAGDEHDVAIAGEIDRVLDCACFDRQ
jgi:hypothetical protein